MLSSVMWIIIIFLTLLLMKFYFKFTTGKDHSYTCLAGKTAIVTGANSGIGFATALEFAKRGARVILACRNIDATEKIKNEIIYQTNNHNVIFMHMDLSSFKSIRKFVKHINENEDKIDILVNNAGVGVGLGNKYTEDGLQILMQTNYFGSFLLTVLLLDKLKKSAPSRIINVASTMGMVGFLNLNKLNHYPLAPAPIADIMLYSNSKLCNILFTIALAKKLKGTNVTANSLNPGVVNTEIYRHYPGIIRFLNDCIVNCFFKTIEEGAQTTIYLAASKEVENKSGLYFEESKERSFYWNVNEKLAEELWNKTEDILKLNNS